MSTTATQRAMSVAILAMGGEGGGVLADWIVDVAERSGWVAQTTSVPGVAQRTGATIYYVELFPESAACAAGKDPVLALMPVPGEVDVVIASELMEMGRAVQRGLVTPDRTTLIASTHRVYSMTEKVAMADGRIDSDALLGAGKAAARRFIARDYAQVAMESHSVISSALLGALAASGALPFARVQFEEAIRSSGVGVETSLAAFDAGFREALPATPPPAPLPLRLSRTLSQRIAETFPTGAQEIVRIGAARVAEYQDDAYAARYLERLDPIREADARHGLGDFTLLRETARHLALWMTYEDAVRVADLKIRRSRFERVHQDARAAGSHLVSIHEYLHPSVQEIADILPRRMGERLLNWRLGRRLINGYTGNGRILQTTSIRGFLMLYFIASQRKRRRASLRFYHEQQSINWWLAQVASAAAEDYNLAVEVARLPRLLKGYGETHQRGAKNYESLVAALASLRGRPDAAAMVKKLRDAALADDTGKQLADALQAVPA